MDRRRFIQNALGGTLALAAMQFPSMPAAQAIQSAGGLSKQNGLGSSKIRGVNLGGWLVLEKWMAPTVYRGSDASDEYGLCLELGDKAEARLNHHRESFITAEDFRWIKKCGINTVRLPVGYWALVAPKPYVEASRFVDFAFEQAQQNGLKVLLDLHGAPGSQNGWDHSGKSGPIEWDKDPKNIRETLRVLETFAERYGKHPALFGIELLNEPSDKIPIDTLKKFYTDAYPRIRKYVNPNVAVVFHDSFRAMAWKNFMQAPQYSGVLIDTHLYQTFTDEDRERTAQNQIIFALDRKEILDQMQQEELPTFVGEWSLALPNRSLHGLSPFQDSLASRAYAAAQLMNFENTRGWFFWSYKLEQNSEWNFRYCVERGWLPDNFSV
jgi:glucan 1,3-beta-glucosidase